MKFAFIHAHRRQFPVRRMCPVLEVSPSGYYAWRKRPPSQREQDKPQLLEKIRTIHAASRKTELVHRERFAYIEGFYHRERLHSSLD